MTWRAVTVYKRIAKRRFSGLKTKLDADDSFLFFFFFRFIKVESIINKRIRKGERRWRGISFRNSILYPRRMMDEPVEYL